MPTGGFGFELRLPFSGQAIELGLAPGFGLLPICSQEAAVFQPVQRRVERTLGDLHDVARHLLEALRTLRLIHYSAWLARRWDDPAFPAAFPWFNSQRYWQDRILELKEQVSLMDEGPLSV